MPRTPKPVTPEQQALIDDIVKIHRDVIAAENLLDARRAAIQEAVAAGTPKQAIAAALGISSTSVGRIANGQQ